MRNSLKTVEKCSSEPESDNNNGSRSLTIRRRRSLKIGKTSKPKSGEGTPNCSLLLEEEHSLKMRKTSELDSGKGNLVALRLVEAINQNRQNE